MKPVEIHNHLKYFLQRQQSLVFDTAFRVESFVRIFGSVNKRNSHWNSNSAQRFLDMVVNGDALLLLAQVLQWDSVSSSTTTTRQTLAFQKGYFPLLEFCACDLVYKTTMSHNVNKLFTVIRNNYDKIHSTISTNVEVMIVARNWGDNLDGISVFEVLTTFYSEFFARFKSVIRDYPQILTFVEQLASWFGIWRDGVNNNTFTDPITSSPREIRAATLGHIGKDVDRLLSIVRREYGVAEDHRRPTRKDGVSREQKQDALVAQLTQAYDPPGELREGGARYDNDAAAIQDIRIAPTQHELTYPLEPYLPCSLPGAPHHLPVNSMEKHLDIQFRLLREEMISPVRQSVNVVLADLQEMRALSGSKEGGKKRKKRAAPTTILGTLLTSGGGAYRSSGKESVFFHVYTSAQFTPAKADRQSLTIGLRVEVPSGPARDKSAQKRAEYWEHSRRLSMGGLATLVVSSREETRMFLGTLQSRADEIGQSAKSDREHVEVRVSFFDTEIELYALRNEEISDPANGRYAFLIDNNVLFESVRPFLETLRSVEPTAIPFSEYIAREGSLAGVALPQPRYSRAPGFCYDLSCLMEPGEAVDPLSTQNEASVARVRMQLKMGSYLDQSQADSVVDTLTREISLIQGPPGTGKSFVGKELLRVFFKNKISPIVLIAYTNHALDHMLRSVLEAGITKNIVRLGSRSADELVAQYNLFELEKRAPPTSMRRALQREYAAMKGAQEQMEDVIHSIQVPSVHWSQVKDFLDLHEPELAQGFNESAPAWVREVYEYLRKEEADGGEWTQVDKGGKHGETGVPDTLYGLWRRGLDLDFIRPSDVGGITTVAVASRLMGSAAGVNSSATYPAAHHRQEFFESIGYDSVPPMPVPSVHNRSIEELQGVDDVWSLTFDDRTRLVKHWKEEVRQMAYRNNLEEFEYLRARYLEACQNYENVRNESRRELLRRTELIGCTTTGAAKLVSLLNAVSPKVLMVEEAGQVLEAHILASLVPSVQQLICIGDPQQLRPTLATFRLSMDNPVGGRIYKFDRSLMERLSDNGAPMSLINVQRRMRSQIAHYPRLILYPTLRDHKVVQQYPDVQGMRQNVFFMTHTHQENNEKDSVSKYNMFEVELIRDLVVYFLKQGPYTGKGDIAVLCAYLGQLQKVRTALKDAKLSISLDERDKEQLERQGEEPEPGEAFESVQISQHIRLGTVDTFQGEEAKIVIVSLVRNSGDFAGESPIGFLKVINRVNVALSRAKHGQYILGNAANLRRNDTWASILDEMEANGQVGHALPIVCPRHPHTTRDIDGPNQLPLEAPEGGCLAPCDHQLKCGHTCQSVCHPDPDLHARIYCMKPCPRISCPRQHPCPQECGRPCGECEFPMRNVKLPCNHVAKTVKCHQLENLASIECKVKVDKRLPFCEHVTRMECSQDPANVQCEAICECSMPCCSRACPAPCFQCRTLTNPDAKKRVVRTAHVDHPCERLLYCQHLCNMPCAQDHQCNPQCTDECRMRCVHRWCDRPCSEPCPPCMEPCAWICEHHSCPVPCGSICSRLPCDEPCMNILPCGHWCPSICGEICANQRCVACMHSNEKEEIVDLIMGATLADVDLTSAALDQRLITLACGHIFTVETLDGHCRMTTFYEAEFNRITGAVDRYIDVKAPPVDYQSPPACPNCRGPISALRYGRITKRASLDILERNVASTMSKALNATATAMQTLDARMPELQKAAGKLKDAVFSKTEEEVQKIVVNWRASLDSAKFDEPTPTTLLRATNQRGFGVEEAKAWKEIVQPLFDAYNNVGVVASSKGPHMQTYEAALSTLYRLELHAIARAGVSATPELDAMQQVDKKIGQPPHKADTRFQVDAFMSSVEIRLRIAQIGCARYDILDMQRNKNKSAQRHLWIEFLEIIYTSCAKDASTARDMAIFSCATRQAARCAVLVRRVRMEHFRFLVFVQRGILLREGKYHGGDRQELVHTIRNHQASARAASIQEEMAYVQSRRCKTLSDMQRERKWFRENGYSKLNKYIDEYDKLAEHIEKDTAYAPLSAKEMEDVVRGLDFGYRGHFYNCENGHTFVITECGGATEMARCPECNCPIGGSNHQLVSSNTRAMEYENISRALGGHDPHWEWGQGA